jgi:hypothetical protein
MPDPDDSVRRGDDDVEIDPIDIQFDQAEYTTPVPDGPSCGVCKSAIDGEYYEMGGKVCCASCRHQVEAAFRGGSRVARVLKALIFGSLASVAGAVLYYVILTATGYHFGLVAVVVGAMVGKAVRKGTGDRGGRFYQLLAVYLTYSAIVVMQVPQVLEDLAEPAENEQQAELEVAKADKDVAKPKAQSKVPNAGKESPTASQLDGQTNPAVAPNVTSIDSALLPQEKSAVVQDVGATDVNEEPTVPDPAQVLLVALSLIGLFYKFPVLEAIDSPISGLIFGFALWEAWKVTRRVQLSFNGPFRVSTKLSSRPAPEAERDGQ